jgi:hypothetical protein
MGHVHGDGCGLDGCLGRREAVANDKGILQMLAEEKQIEVEGKSVFT